MVRLHPVGITGCERLLGREIAVLAFGNRVEFFEVVLLKWHIIITINVIIIPYLGETLPSAANLKRPRS